MGTNGWKLWPNELPALHFGQKLTAYPKLQTACILIIFWAPLMSSSGQNQARLHVDDSQASLDRGLGSASCTLRQRH